MAKSEKRGPEEEYVVEKGNRLTPSRVVGRVRVYREELCQELKKRRREKQKAGPAKPAQGTQKGNG